MYLVSNILLLWGGVNTVKVRIYTSQSLYTCTLFKVPTLLYLTYTVRGSPSSSTLSSHSYSVASRWRSDLVTVENT